ncbi:hypothetical protein O3V59_09340, partial [Brevibacillus thermoruber]
RGRYSLRGGSILFRRARVNYIPAVTLKCLLAYTLSGAYIFLGGVFVYMLADSHALGYTLPYYISYISYHIIGVLIVAWIVTSMFTYRATRGKKAIVLDSVIYIAWVFLTYVVTDIFIKQYVAHFV